MWPPGPSGQCGRLAETVVDGVTGILVTPRNPEELARTAASLLQDETKCIRMGEAGRMRAVEIYNWRRIVDWMLEVYKMAQRNQRMCAAPPRSGFSLK